MKFTKEISAKAVHIGWRILLFSLLLAAYFAASTRQAYASKDLKGVAEMVAKLPDRKTSSTERVRLVKSLSEMGPAAKPALATLLDPEFYFDHVKKNSALKKALIETLINIGEPSIDVVMELTRDAPQKKKTGPAESKAEAKKNRKREKRVQKLKEMMQGEVDGILRKLAENGLAHQVIAALEEDLLKNKRINSNTLKTIAMMGPEAAPAIKRIMKKRKLYYPSIIGNDPDFSLHIPDQYTPELWHQRDRNKRVALDYRKARYANPDPKHMPALLDPIRDDRLLRGDYHNAARRSASVFDGMGEAPALPLAKLLEHENPTVRWTAAVTLGMTGPNMKPAIPALTQAMKDSSQRIDVRLAAARAMAQITETDAAPLVASIPDAADEIIKLTRHRQKEVQEKDRWKLHIASSTTHTFARHLALYSKTKDWETPLYQMAVNQNVKEVNQWLRTRVSQLKRGTGEGMSLDSEPNEAQKFLLFFGADSKHYPGRLAPDVERLLKDYVFGTMYHGKQFDPIFWEQPGKSARYSIKTVEFFKIQLAKDEDARILEMSNGPMRYEARQLLGLQILQSDPEYASKKFKNGDTVAERYKYSIKLMARGLKGLALHGMWSELGSTNYEHKTYRGLLELAEFAIDPVVQKRAKMFMDLAFMEIEQISINGLRGGSKTRCKDPGLSGRFNAYLRVFYGEHPARKLETPGFKSYQPPVPAILLRKMGPTEPVYEIANRHVGERHTLKSRSLNYAYCTPEYVTGCAMYDIRLWEKEPRSKGKTLQYGTMGRWSGVVFRNNAGIELPAYTGEKYNVQSKDVMIAQIYRGAKYSGEPVVDFTAIDKMEESGDWVFVDMLDAYAAVRPARGGYYWSQPARRQMNLNDHYAPIIIQTGRKAVYGSFEKFQKAILSAPFKINEDVLDYTGPNNARIEFFMCKNTDDEARAYPKRLPLIDGKELDLNLKHNYKSPYINGSVGSDIVKVTYGDRTWEYDFGKNEIR